MSGVRREVLAEGIEIWRGDCREVLAALGPVGALVTDPPYGIVNTFGVQNRAGGRRTLQFEWDGLQVNAMVLESLRRAGDLAPAFFAFCGASQISHIEALLGARFTVKPAVWIKACPPPPMPGNWWPSGFEYALYGYTPGAWFGDGAAKRCNVFYSDTYRHGVRAEEKVDHPTQKWLPLMEQIVGALCPPGETVLDPFMGSGTTGVAAVNLCRRFIGIEMREDYFDIARRRIADALSRPRLPIAEPARRVAPVAPAGLFDRGEA